MSYQETLTRLIDSGNFRSIPADRTADDAIVDLSSNDYLGLAARTDLVDQFFNTIDTHRPAMSASASRLLQADQHWHLRLEDRLTRLYGRPALLFNSGYHANTGLISALASEPKTLILADRLVHASIIDGMVLSRAEFLRFNHNDLNHLERHLRNNAPKYDRIIVVAESIYSMDGDSADIEGLIDLKRPYPNAMLYIDEAHAFGVKGRDGLGLAASSARADEVDIIVGTFGKAAASAGAFAILSPTLRDYAINRARSFIFSTALPPINCAWTDFIVERLPRMEAERNHLASLERTLFDGLAGLPQTASLSGPSHIMPFIIGDARLTIDLSARLLESGFKVLPIRTPTVPPGTERLRISLSASITTERIEQFTKTLIATCNSL